MTQYSIQGGLLMEYDTEKGLSLIKKGKRGLIRVLFSRVGVITLLMLIQLGVLIVLGLRFSEVLPHVFGSSVAISFFMGLVMINSKMESSSIIMWLMIMLLMPVFGVLLFWYTRSELGHRALKQHLNNILEVTQHEIVQDPQVLDQLKQQSSDTASLASYLLKCGSFPVYQNTDVVYFKSGEEKFEALQRELKKAEKFIFLEYFIVDEGMMWGKILETLALKVKEGVEVKVLIDGSCEFTTLPHDYPLMLKKLGIECRMFAPVMPFVSTHYNYRDHRKIAVIDNRVAFTGGINLADEYINQINRFGHWKDTAVMLSGKAVESFTLMFLQMWMIEKKGLELQRYLLPHAEQKAQGYVIPYADNPLDAERVGQKVYLDILNRAVNYVHIMTPYLILDYELENALKFAAQRGVDVSIIVPGIPDKKSAYALMKTHYASLLEAGVHLYEYTPGFVHAKVFVSDDIKAVVGTINLDYRSLVHHFECAAYLYQTECIDEIEKDFRHTLLQCAAVDESVLKKVSPVTKIMGFVLKVLAPLM